jgi:hypothetical protein
MAVKKIKHDHLSTRGAIILVVFILVLVGATYLFTRYMLIKSQASGSGKKWTETKSGKIYYSDNADKDLKDVTIESLRKEVDAFNKYMKEKYGKEPHYKLEEDGTMSWYYQ